MEYWKNKKNMNSLWAAVVAFTSVFGALTWMAYRLDNALKEVGMTSEEFWSGSANNDVASDAFVYILLALYAISVILFFYGKYKIRQES